MLYLYIVLIVLIYFIFVALIVVVSSMSLWFRDIIAEGTFLGDHTLAVQKGLNLGVIIIYSIRSIVFLSYFLSFFP